MWILRFFLVFLMIWMIWGCEQTAYIPATKTINLDVPVGFPEPIIPDNNQLSEARIALGKKLFFEPALSLDSSISCASCHKQELAFADDRPVSPGIKGRLGFRNAPSLANMAFQPIFHKDGGVPNLDIQAVVPIEDENEMGMNLLDLAERLNQNPAYQEAFLDAYYDIATPFTITRALAAFQRTLISSNSKYDQVQGGEAVFTAEEARGAALFFSDQAQCSSCHSGPNFTNHEFINNGLYLEYEDLGRRRVTILEEDVGKFRVPSLRNIELTAPYMHDGSLPTLEAVLQHYNQGGQSSPLQDERIHPLNLQPQEITDLIAFLKTLTDYDFINNPDFQ